MTSIGIRAFAGTGLTSITIPDGVTDVGGGVFRDCANLTSVVTGSGLMMIAHEMFAGSENLTSVTIGSGVSEIGRNAFDGCTGLMSVTSLNPVPPNLVLDNRCVDGYYLGEPCLSPASFQNLPTGVRLYVPEESKAAYENSEWANVFESMDIATVSIKHITRSPRSGIAADSRVTIRNRTLTVRSLSESSVSRIRLLDMRGKSVARFTARGNATFALANIPAGRYFVEVRDRAGRMERGSVVVGGR